MSNARNLSKVEVDTNGDIEVGSLGNANDASALTTGTLGSARLPAGSVIQVVAYNKTDASAYSGAGTTHKPLEVNLTTKGANSKFIVAIHLSHSAFNISNRDPYNWSMQAGYKTSTASSNPADYIGFGGRSGVSANSDAIGMGGYDYPLYQSDVPEGHTDGPWGSDYEIRQKSFVLEVSPSIASNTAVYFSTWIRVANYLVVSGPDYVYGGLAYNGAVSTMVVYEVTT